MNFEHLDVWKRSVKLSCEIYKSTANLKDYGFRDQLTRSALSVPSNIAEGVCRESFKEKSRFIDIARASLGEARTQIYIGNEIGYLPKGISQVWVLETKELAAMLTSLKNRFDSA
ncbi:four helix bundle protein [Pseudoalteromonas sp. APC 3356]|uniref:four helix bundle protein n=1 Tax=unclassified Pseudoalteromonas TaxID=194690 RepID=UPI0003102FB1|nr:MULTISPECIES: four helix bundle protein [unclassified Pseudoalteromonas]MDN3434324.1 four helix bundle protein [Pseudoalteromonas sp. APC 3356]TMS92208.1 four helix bundle protein [Pseudoalteromonas sp. S201]